MGDFKKTYFIKGMHCASCELLIEDEVTKIPGVKKCKVNFRNGIAEISSNTQLKLQDVQNAIEEAGYTLGKDEKNFFSHNINDYISVFTAILGVFALYFLAKAVGIFDLGSQIGGSYNNLPVVFLIGITAGVSTCMAIVGGLVLGASARFAEKHPRATPLQKFKPHVFFNLGRITSYIILGGVIGFLGSILQLSSSFTGLLTIAVGFVMLLLGIQLTELIPGVNKVKITLPSWISKKFGINNKSSAEYSHTNSAIMGALTFFLPCGFTQAMQLYSISTGSALIGALTMGTFALGTAPGLLGIGGLTSVVKGAFARHFFRFAGVIVVFLAFFNIANGINLTGFNTNSVLSYTNSAKAEGQKQQADDPNVTLENGIQTVKMTQTGNGYEPNSFTIQKGIPVKWVINSIEPYSCAASILMPEFKIAKVLSKGENIIEFIPSKLGTLSFSCNMGMYTGKFNVVEAEKIPANTPASEEVSSIEEPISPTETPEPAKEEAQSDIQIIKATYSLDNDIQPNQFKVKANQPVSFEINALDDGMGCMGSVVVIGQTEPKGFQKGKTTKLTFTPKNGKYTIACAMGVPRGEILAE